MPSIAITTSSRPNYIAHDLLFDVISMHSGVFKPYAGVSTAILIFTKTYSGGTDKVWFYDMRADGFSLDDKRNPVSDNDIPDGAAVREGDERAERNVEGGERRMKKGWEHKKFKDVATVIGGNTPKTDVQKYWDGTHYWVTPAELDGSK